LIAVIANDDRRDSVFLEFVGFETITRVDFPSQSIGVHPTVHEEPHIVPIDGIDWPIVDGEVETEDPQIRDVAVRLRSENRVFNTVHPIRGRKFYSRNHLDVEASDQVVIGRGELPT
jgi:hypothetical protein